MADKKGDVNVAMSIGSIQGARTEQQDYCTAGQEGKRTIAIVCDGMGGLNGGAIASKTAANLLLEDLQNLPPDMKMYTFCEKELERLDDAVYSLKDGAGNRLHGGTTLVAALIEGEEFNWFSVGDSKLLYFRGKECHCVTREHNYAMYLRELQKEQHIDEKMLLEGEKRGEQLISYLGMGTAELFDANHAPFKMQKNDKVLLCTDGVYRTLSMQEITAIVSCNGTVEEISELLKNALLFKRKAKQDNASWIVLQIV